MKKSRLYGFLALILAVPLAAAYIMGADDRVEAAGSGEAAVRQTGMIRIQDEDFVSGLLTGENCDVVVSAGHAAIYWQDVARRGWQKGSLRSGGRFYFNLDPARADGWRDMELVASGYRDPDRVGLDAHDWSVFRIARPLSRDCAVIPLWRGGPECESGLVMPGYHFDRPRTRLLARHCGLKQARENAILVHDCDSKEGSSGAPLLCRDGARLSLLAINISGVTHRDYFDAGEYGKSGRRFHRWQHRNFALAVRGEFQQALQGELRASAKRRALRDE